MSDITRRVIVSSAIKKDGKYLFTQQGTGGHKGLWMFPGGGLELEDANLIDAVHREVKEEVGLEIANEKLLDVFSFLVPENNLQMVTIFYTSECLSGNVSKSKEINDFRWMTIEELKSFPHNQVRLPGDLYDKLMSKL